MSELLARSVRARALSRLAALTARGISLPEALEAIAAELPKRAAKAVARGVNAAREGASLDVVLGASRLASARDRAVVAAARDKNEALALIGDECRAREETATTVRRVLVAPAWKLVAFVFFGTVVAWATYGPLALRAHETLEGAVDWSYVDVMNVPITGDYPLARIGGRLLLRAAAMLASIAVVAVGARTIARNRHGRRALEGAGGHVPIAATLIRLETSATFLRTLGTGLASGLDLGAALDRCGEALDGRLVAAEVASAARRAREGASITDCLAPLSFLDATTAWLVEAASARPDLPREVLALGRSFEQRFRAEGEKWAPFLHHLPEVSLVAVVAWTAIANLDLTFMLRRVELLHLFWW